MKLGMGKDNVMYFEQYIKKAKETESVDFNTIRRRLRDEQLLRLLHAGMGMVTETSELFVAIENIFPERFGGHPKELMWLIDEAREKFVEYLTEVAISSRKVAFFSPTPLS